MKQSYILNMETDRVRPYVCVSQFDTNRTIEFNLVYGDESYTPTSPKIIINSTEISGTISGTKVSFLVPSSLTENYGRFEGELRDDNIGSLNFDFIVDRTPLMGANQENLTLSRALSIVFGRTITENNESAWNILQGD